ncbi:hypothetical protein OXX79_013850 [Metschnikowia pulcherrima]
MRSSYGCTRGCSCSVVVSFTKWSFMPPCAYGASRSVCEDDFEPDTNARCGRAKVVSAREGNFSKNCGFWSCFAKLSNERVWSPYSRLPRSSCTLWRSRPDPAFVGGCKSGSSGKIGITVS